jgi:hypothetical protein
VLLQAALKETRTELSQQLHAASDRTAGLQSQLAEEKCVSVSVCAVGADLAMAAVDHSVRNSLRR